MTESQAFGTGSQHLQHTCNLLPGAEHLWLYKVYRKCPFEMGLPGYLSPEGQEQKEGGASFEGAGGRHGEFQNLVQEVRVPVAVWCVCYSKLVVSQSFCLP